jgi:ankyrin repeat protein
MLNELINFNKLSIGISIIDIKDRLGLTALHYSVIFNNFETLKILIENNADPYLLSNDGSNIFVTCLTYKRNNMIDYLIKNKFNLNFISHSGETLLQMAVNYQNNESDLTLEIQSLKGDVTVLDAIYGNLLGLSFLAPQGIVTLSKPVETSAGISVNGLKLALKSAANNVSLITKVYQIYFDASVLS